MIYADRFAVYGCEPVAAFAVCICGTGKECASQSCPQLFTFFTQI